MNVGYYSIDNTETDGQIPTNDYPTTYNVLDRFNSVLLPPEIPISKENLKWENISNVVVDSNGNTYYLLKLDVNNTTYLKFIVVSVDGRLLVQQNIDHPFKKIDTTQKDLIHLLNKDRSTFAVFVNDNNQLYRFYYTIKSSGSNLSNLEMNVVEMKNVKRVSKEKHININTNSIPYEPRVSPQGSSIYALIQPDKDQSLSSNNPCLLSVKFSNQQIIEDCIAIKNRDVFQFLPSIEAETENAKNDVRFDFATDYDVFSSPINEDVADPTVLSFLGPNIKVQRFGWSNPNFYYASEDGIGYYLPNKDPLKSSVDWEISKKELSTEFSSTSSDFVAFSSKNKHLFACINENNLGENGHLLIIDSNNEKVYEDKTVPCSKNSLVLLSDKTFVSSTKDGINYYSYDKNFKINKLKSIPAKPNGSFITSPVVYNGRLYVNGNVFCNDTLSKDLISGNQINQLVKAEKDNESFFKTLIIGIGALIILLLLGFLLFINKRRRNKSENEIIIRDMSNQSKEDSPLEDDDFDLNLSVGVRNSSTYDRLNSKRSFSSSKHTINSHISQRSLIKKKESDQENELQMSNVALLYNQNGDARSNVELGSNGYNPIGGDDDDCQYDNENFNRERLRNYHSQDSLPEIRPMSPIAEEKHQYSIKGSINSAYHVSNSDTNSSDFQDAHDYFNYPTMDVSEYNPVKEMSTTLVENSDNLLSQTFTTNDSTFVFGDKHPEDDNQSSTSILHKNSKPPSTSDRNQNASNGSETKAGLVKSKVIPKPHAQQMIIVNQMIAEDSPLESSPSGSKERETDSKSEKSRKSFSYLASLTPPFLYKLKSSYNKNQNENNSEKSLLKIENQHYNDSSSTILSSKTVKPLKSSDSIPEEINNQKTPMAVRPSALFSGEPKNTLNATVFNRKSTQSLRSNSTTSTIKDTNNSSSNNTSAHDSENEDENEKEIEKEKENGNDGEKRKEQEKEKEKEKEKEVDMEKEIIISGNNGMEDINTLSDENDFGDDEKTDDTTNNEEENESENENENENAILPPTAIGTLMNSGNVSKNGKSMKSKDNNLEGIENGGKKVYKKPLRGKQSKASLMSVDPLKIDSNKFKEKPHLSNLFLEEDGIPPPPEANLKNILSSDNSSDISFRSTRSSGSNYSERLHEIKHQYRQFQNSLHNQNKSSNESDRGSLFSNASSSSHPLDEMNFHLNHEPIIIPPPPVTSRKTNNIFSQPSRNSSRSSLQAGSGSTSYYSASSDILSDGKDSLKRSNKSQYSSKNSTSSHDGLSDNNGSVVSYTDPSNDNASVFSFHSCINDTLPYTASPSSSIRSKASRNVFAKRDSDQFSHRSNSTTSFYSLKSAQFTTQSLPPSIVNSIHGNANSTSNASSIGGSHSNLALPVVASPQSSFANSPFMSSPTMNSPPRDRDSLTSNTSFQSAFDDRSVISSTNASISSSQITNPFLRGSIASSTSTSSYGVPIQNSEWEIVSPMAKQTLGDGISLASASESFHTVNSNLFSIRNQSDVNVSGPPSMTSAKRNEFESASMTSIRKQPQPQDFNDIKSFVSAADSFHTVNSNMFSVGSHSDINEGPSTPKRKEFESVSMVSGQKPQDFSDINSFVSATDSFHTVNTTNIPAPVKYEYESISSPLVEPPPPMPQQQQVITDDGTSFLSATESFHTIQSLNIPPPKKYELEETTASPTPVGQNFGDDVSSFVSAADSFHTVKTNATQATDTTTSTFKSAMPNYNPFLN